MSANRTTTEILVDLAAARLARTALVAGEQVEDVWRDGRRVKYSTMTLAEMNEQIRELEREYAAAAEFEGGGARRAAIGHYY